MALSTSYLDDILAASMEGKRKFKITHSNGISEEVTIEDISDYEQLGSIFGAKDINETNKAVNEKLPMSGGILTGAVTFTEDAAFDGMLYMKNAEMLSELLRAITGEEPVLIINDGMYTAGIGGLNLSAGKAVRLIIKDERIVLEKSADETHSANLRPYNDNKCTLGTAAKRFYGLWAGNSTIQTADARYKRYRRCADTV